MVEYGRLDGKARYFCRRKRPGIVINKALFEKAGIPLPKQDWDWEEYAAISKELSDKLGDGVRYL